MSITDNCFSDTEESSQSGSMKVMYNGNLGPHHETAVQILYKRIMGFKDMGGQGAILADKLVMENRTTTVCLIQKLMSIPSPNLTNDRKKYRCEECTHCLSVQSD